MAKKKSELQELSEFIRDHMVTKEDHTELRGHVIRLGEQVNSIETQLKEIKHTHLEARVADLEQHAFGKVRPTANH